MIIPKQLKDYRFIRTYRKNPIQVGWPLDSVRFTKQNNETYLDNHKGTIYKSKGKDYTGKINSYDKDEIEEYLETSKIQTPNTTTYGVLCGYNGLVVIDIDDKKVADRLKNIWPFSSTFTVLSGGKQFPHFYFKCEDYSPVIRYDNSAGKRLLDIQGTSTFVIGPNSTIRSNNENKKYIISNDEEILDISFQNLLNAIEENLGEAHKIQKKEKHIYTDKFFIVDPITSEIFRKIDCTTVLEEANIDVSSNPGDTPFAKSENKKCLHRTQYLWYDHHIQEGGNVIQLYSRIHNIDSVRAKYDLAERVGVTDEIYKQALQYYIKNQQHELTELLTIKFMSTNSVYTIRSDKFTEIYVYKDGIYIPEGMTMIKEFCDNFLGKWYTTLMAKKIVDKITVRSYIDQEEFFKEGDIKYMPVENGILNILSGKLYNFTPEKRFFNKLPVKYDPRKTCEVTKQHYQTILNGQKDVDVIQELYGYLLYRDYKFEKVMMFYGNGGNGKSKSIEQMKHLIGDTNSTNISLFALQKEKFLRCNLHRKLANLADDIGQAKLEETEIFKQLTGHGMITADRKFNSTISFINYAKMVFSANTIPDTVDDTDSFWRRWIMVGFTKKFISEPEYEYHEKQGTLEEHHRKADTEIIKKLTTPDELSGVLNWALGGLARLLRNNGFSRAESYDEVRNLWKRKVSSAIAFMQDKIKLTYHPDDYIVQEDMYKNYVDYCIKNKTRAELETNFKKLLQNENLISQRKHVAHGYEWRWNGVKIK